MNGSTRTLVVLALTAALTLTGCVDSISDGDSGLLGSQSAEAEENLAIHLTAENVPEDAGHLGLVFKDVYVHNAANASGEGYFPLNLKTNHADLVSANGSSSVQAAAGSVPAGTYDQTRFQLRSLDGGTASAEASGNASGNASDDGHAHDHGGDGHAHDDSSGEAKTEIPTDIPVNLTFEVTEDELTKVDLVIDVGASLEGGSFDPVITRAEITVGGETDTVDDVSVLSAEQAGEIGAGTSGPSTSPPVARIDVFGPDGAKVYETDFEAKGGDFVNSKASAFGANQSIRFSGTASEAVETGATLEQYTWDFGDGTTSTGPNVEHAYQQFGAFEATLTVTDSEGATDDMTVRLVVFPSEIEWNTQLYNSSFEDGPGDWAASSDGDTTWELDGSGPNSSTAWHVGNHAAHVYGTPVLEEVFPGYTSGAEASLTSPSIALPDNLVGAGFSFQVGGYSEACCDYLTVKANWDGGSANIGQFSPGSWVEVRDKAALTDAAGKDVTFTFTFTADANVETGNGILMDDFVVGGMQVDLVNAELLEEGAGDGHDHEH